MTSRAGVRWAGGHVDAPPVVRPDILWGFTQTDGMGETIDRVCVRERHPAGDTAGRGSDHPGLDGSTDNG